MAVTRKLTVVKPPTSTTLERTVSDYLASKEAGGLSPRTVDMYQRTLEKEFLPFVRDQGITTTHEIDQRLLDRWGTHLLHRQTAFGRPLSKQSAYTYLNTVGNFIAWCKKEGEITSQAKPQLPRLPRRVLTMLTRKQIQAMEDAATEERDKLIVRVLADTGIRLGELLSLTEESLIDSGRQRYLKVHGKGDKERLVPVELTLYRRLRRYIEVGRPDAATDRIFTTLRRNHRSGEFIALGHRPVQSLFVLLARKAGIPKGVECHPHSLRHAFATHALRRGIPLLSLQHVLGHANLHQIVQTYSHLTPEDDAKALMAVLRDA